MTRAIAFGSMLIAAAFLARGYTTQAEAGEGWTGLTQDLADLRVELAHAEASVRASAPIQDWRWDDCRFQGVDPAVWSPREERLTLDCVVERFGPISGGVDKAVQVALCESNMWRLAYNPRGPYAGLYQHALAYWPDRVSHAMPRAWRVGPWQRWSNSRSQIVTTVRMVHGSGGWSAWSCA